MNLRAFFFLMRMNHLYSRGGKLNTFIIKYDKVRCAKRLYPSVHLCLSKQSDWTRCLFKEMAN